MTPLYQETSFREKIFISDCGYWILPSGTVLSLSKNMTYAETVESYIGHTSDQPSFETALKYERSRDPDISKYAVVILWARRHLGWISLHIEQVSDQPIVHWVQTPTERAKESLRTLFAEHEFPANEEISSNHGMIIGWKNLKAKMDATVYRRV